MINLLGDRDEVSSEPSIRKERRTGTRKVKRDVKIENQCVLSYGFTSEYVRTSIVVPRDENFDQTKLATNPFSL